ncbi:MAG: hypothetical protein PF482_13675 [Desulfobacteraceae bacterium]|nr:hypothetical protein [Desulfobacteraceae bacterium]
MIFITAKDIATNLKKSVAWVYNHAHELGGAHIGGSWIFTEEAFINAIQARQEMARSRQIQENPLSSINGNQARSYRMGNREKKGIEKSREKAAKRHGLDDLLHQVS